MFCPVGYLPQDPKPLHGVAWVGTRSAGTQWVGIQWVGTRSAGIQLAGIAITGDLNPKPTHMDRFDQIQLLKEIIMLYISGMILLTFLYAVTNQAYSRKTKVAVFTHHSTVSWNG